MAKVAAIMQPYIFPYIGYFNLIHAASDFVFYDDVNYITKGWVNRNSIVAGGSPYRFTVPLSAVSRDHKIHRVKLLGLQKFKVKFLKTLRHAYKGSPHFDLGFQYVNEVLSLESNYLSELAIHSVVTACELVGLERRFHSSSEKYSDSSSLNRADRLIDISMKLEADKYVNPVGGTALYSKSHFASRGITLNFIHPIVKEYSQKNTDFFLTGMSIIDVFMCNDISTILRQIESYELK